MKSLIAERAKRNNAKIQENAKTSKKLVGNQKNTLQKDQPKETRPSEVEIVKEPQTLMLDVQ